MDTVKTGNFIKELRTEKGLTQKELAEKLNVSAAAVSKWENGKGFPDISLLEPLSFELGIFITELIKGEKSFENKESDSVAKEIIKISRKNIKYERARQIFVVGVLSFTLILIIAFILFDVFSAYRKNMDFIIPTPSILGLAMFLFGGNAVVFSVFGLVLSGKTDVKKSMQILLFSEACCAASIWFGSVYTGYKISINDISAVMDTANAIELFSRVLFFSTSLINIFSYLKTSKNK